MIGLTKRQAETLDYIEQQQIPPTLREIGGAMGIRSTNGVNDHIRALERKGRITRRGMNMKTRQLLVIVPLTILERVVFGFKVVQRCTSCGHVIDREAVSERVSTPARPFVGNAAAYGNG